MDRQSENESYSIEAQRRIREALRRLGLSEPHFFYEDEEQNTSGEQARGDAVKKEKDN